MDTALLHVIAVPLIGIMFYLFGHRHGVATQKKRGWERRTATPEEMEWQRDFIRRSRELRLDSRSNT